MTVAAITPEQTYLGNGSAAPLAVPFRFLAVDDLVVTRIASGDVRTVLARGVDYSVAGAGGSAGTVTPLAAIPVGTSWTIGRRTARSQSTDYVTGDAFPAETHEQALDRQMMVVQEIDAALNVAEDTLVGLVDDVAAAVANADATAAVAALLAGTSLSFSTYAAAAAGIAAVSADAYVQVLEDETKTGERTLYRKTAGAYAFIGRLGLTPTLDERFFSFQGKALYAGGGIAMGVDSLTNGAGSTFRTYLTPLMRALTGRDGGFGYASFNNGVTGLSGFFKTDAWIYNSLSDVNFGSISLDGLGLYCLGGTGLTTDRFTWAIASKWTSGRLYYHKGPGSTSFQYRFGITGGFTTVSTNSATDDVGYIDITLANGATSESAVLEVRAPVGNVLLQGFRALLDPLGFWPANLSSGGRLFHDVALQNSAMRKKWFAALGVSAIEINGGMNDRITISAAQHQADLEAFITDFQTALPNAAVFIVQSNEPADAQATNFKDYTARKITVAKAKGAAYFDERRVLGNYAQAVALGLMIDGVHPSEAANRLRAQMRATLYAPVALADAGATAWPGGGGATTPTLSGTLSEKRTATITAASPTTAYDIGLINGFPVCLIELTIVSVRVGTSAGRKKRVLLALTNGVTPNNASLAGTAAQAPSIISEHVWVAGDASAGDYTVTTTTANSRVQIVITPTGVNQAFVVTGTYSLPSNNQVGQAVYEN